ncbi:non-structural maintenance of chromosomes element 3 homolog [Dendronephthya gigantea]|uniref:non-structural maintenance of chromosomes element 3 homolog n=1 Tax=Dendronephthya gigantea TaxID=151771 RepID=UPI00106B55F7|nr:non-structural maintenance of chromosomes element 3 homolog [Dendronephthya gigantea]
MPRRKNKGLDTQNGSDEETGVGLGSQATQKRRGRKRHDPAEDDEDGGTQSSQAKITLSKAEMDRKVADFVRYILFMDSKKTAVRRSDLNKHVLKEHTKLFVPVFTEAQNKIKKTFGYELLETELNKQKVYILLNKMQEEANQVVQSNADDQPKLGLLLVILATIFMKDNVLNEGTLWDTLKRLGVFKGENHEIFGDVEKLITVEYVKQMYLDRKKVITGDTATYEYRWGVRSQHEITKRQVLEFVAQVYGTEVQAWTAKYKEVVQEEEGDSGSD